MIKCVYGMEQVDAVIDAIKDHGSKLVYVAGASASGKTHFNKSLSLALEKQ